MFNRFEILNKYMLTLVYKCVSNYYAPGYLQLDHLVDKIIEVN